MYKRHFLIVTAGLLLLMTISCAGPKKVTQPNAKNYQPSSVPVSNITANIPDYHAKLHAVRGKARAIVSSPGNTQHLSLKFSSNRSKSLVTIRNRLGIEGGQLLSGKDTLIVYNKVDKFARKIPIGEGRLKRINKLASLNILEMINYKVSADSVRRIMENESTYKLMLTSDAQVIVDKKSTEVRQVLQPKDSDLPYRKITYDAYGTIKGFKLPRRISIFDADHKSKIALQLTQLELNPSLDTLTINLPDDIPVYYR